MQSFVTSGYQDRNAFSLLVLGGGVALYVSGRRLGYVKVLEAASPCNTKQERRLTLERARRHINCLSERERLAGDA